jgi:hypothetical protein
MKFPEIFTDLFNNIEKINVPTFNVSYIDFNTNNNLLTMVPKTQTYNMDNRMVSISDILVETIDRMKQYGKLNFNEIDMNITNVELYTISLLSNHIAMKSRYGGATTIITTENVLEKLIKNTIVDIDFSKKNNNIPYLVGKMYNMNVYIDPKSTKNDMLIFRKNITTTEPGFSLFYTDDGYKIIETGNNILFNYIYLENIS